MSHVSTFELFSLNTPPFQPTSLWKEGNGKSGQLGQAYLMGHIDHSWSFSASHTHTCRITEYSNPNLNCNPTPNIYTTHRISEYSNPNPNHNHNPYTLTRYQNILTLTLTHTHTRKISEYSNTKPNHNPNPKPYTHSQNLRISESGHSFYR